MSDKSFGENVNRNVVKNPLLSTAVTGLTFEDLTLNAVLVPVAPNQGQTIESDYCGNQRSSLANTDNDFTHAPRVDQNLNTNQNVLSPQSSSFLTQPHSLDKQIGHNYDKSHERFLQTDSKASVKSEDDFDVDEYFARLQGTRYVSAPLNSHPDPNANLLPTEDNLEEINLNDDKTVEVQQSLTADIAHNLSQLPNVLPHVANTVFSSFSNMWSMKSREQTPDDKDQGHHNICIQNNQPVTQTHQPHSYTEVKFQGDQNLEPKQFQEPNVNFSNVPGANIGDAMKRVGPPPREPPVCGTSSFRLSSKMKYAQIPGLATKESQSLFFSPITQNVPSYFVPSEESHEKSQERDILIPEHVVEQKQQKYNEISNPLIHTSDNIATNTKSVANQKTETPNHLHSQPPVLPPPPMFSSQRRQSQTGKSVLPPSIARRIGTNNPIIKQQIMPPSETVGNILVPNFDSTPNPQIFSPQTGNLTPQIQTYNPESMTPNVNDTESPLYQEKISTVSAASHPISPDFHPQTQGDSIIFLPTDKPAPQIESIARIHSTSGIPTLAADNISLPPYQNTNNPQSGPLSQPASSNLCAPSVPVTDSVLTPAEILSPRRNTIDPPPTIFKNTEPPRSIVSSNFRMVSKRPQYYSGPIEGIGSISNSVKPEIPALESTIFQGAVFTPEQTYAVKSDDNQEVSNTTNTPFNITATERMTESNQMPNPSYNSIQSSHDYSQQYTTAFDFSRPPTGTHEDKDANKESKGFGIIGSLKSKLSSLDINKIQNSVTTFFDPSFNHTTKPTEHTTYESTTSNPLPYESQSNFEIFVPNAIETHPYDYNCQTYQPPYEQAYQPYSYPFSQEQVHNIGYQSLPTNVAAANTQNSSDTIMYSFPTQENQDCTPAPIDKSFAQIYEKTELMDIQTSSKTQVIIPLTQTLLSNTGPTEKPQLSDVHLEEKVTELDTLNFLQDHSIQNDTLMGTQVVSEPINIITGEIPAHENESCKLGAGHYLKPTACLSTLTPEKLIGNPDVFYTDSSVKENTCKMPAQHTTEIKPETWKSNSSEKSKHYDMTEHRSEEISWFPNISHSNIETQHKTTEILTKISQDLTTQIKPESDHLLKSITKGDVPLLAVSAVPLFGLSTVIADKAKEYVGNKIDFTPQKNITDQDSSDKTVGISFFENFASDVAKDANVCGIDNIPSTGFFNKDDIKMDAFGAHNTKCEYFSGYEKQETFFDKKAALYDTIDDARKTADSDLNKDVITKEKKNIENNSIIRETGDSTTELNICETCREVNKPEEKDTESDDLTTQLIENITSPIQLSNAVEVPLTEDSNIDRVEFDAGQYEEISHITEETIETIHVMSAAELLEDKDIKIMNYGWKTEENYGTLQSTHDGGFGVFGGSLFVDNVPANASDELKAEFKYQEDLLPRQMSIPSAPPAEDFKSDVAGILDVQSIELDAKQDFDHYEEFVIEPSETDDDKIECKGREKTDESELDSFTNRVEKFKKMEVVADFRHSTHIQKTIEIPAQTISMASYFDTGNYAAETHYKNTVSSPFHTSIPPGFEDDFKNKLVVSNPITESTKLESSTVQTALVDSFKLSTGGMDTEIFDLTPVGFDAEQIVSNIIDDKIDPSSSLICDPGKLYDNLLATTSATFSSGELQISQATQIYSSEGEQDKRTENTLKASNLFASGEPKISEVSNLFISGKAKMSVAQHLLGSGEAEVPKISTMFASTGQQPDNSPFLVPGEIKMLEASTEYSTLESKMPLSQHFASQNVIGTPETVSLGENATKKLNECNLPDPINFFTQTTAAPAESFNRLASYFSSPPKTEHAKPFFELSQSQNHYRHEINSEKYNELIKDLTSVQNLAVNTDQRVRHVNYFTVEYENITRNSRGDSEPLLVESDNVDYFSNCRYCTELVCNKKFKVKTAVNENKETGNTMPRMDNVSDTHKQSVTVNFDETTTMSEDTDDGLTELTENRQCREYGPVKYHWFYRVDVEDKSIWRGFSYVDSKALETGFLSPDLNENTVVATDGGRYDVNILARLRIPIYWSAKPTNVLRCSWFYKGTTDPRYVPYTEQVAEKLENEYQHGVSTGQWHRRLLLPDGEVVVMHGPNMMMHFLHSDASTSTPSTIRPRVVRRGCDESEIEDAEPSSIDHLLLLCHGVGSACDMRFRSVEEVVEDFRATSLQLVQSHYRQSVDRGLVSRVEVLPISWHASLHSGEMGVDRRLAQITLDSIPRLRNFTNDTVLDVLFYTSPVYSQAITNTVCKELNRIYNLFLERNPGFTGGVSLGGHSLGSVILYDLLCHQTHANESPMKDKKTYVSGPGWTKPHDVEYPKLKFEPEALYALGSPIAIFECIRGVESLGRDFSLPTCRNFFNIFHPYDPIAYRIEPLINPELRDLKPYLIPHHKGRKRMHLELKDTMARVGADLKQKLVDSLRSTWNKWKTQPTDGTLEKVVEEDVAKETLCDTTNEQLLKERELCKPAMLGQLNGGRRVDYVLQEAPLEMINEYLFAMSSHVGYWESEDTMLLMLREIYSALGVEPDSTVPQQSLTVERTRTQESAAFSSSDGASTSRGAHSPNTDDI